MNSPLTHPCTNCSSPAPVGSDLCPDCSKTHFSASVVVFCIGLTILTILAVLITAPKQKQQETQKQQQNSQPYEQR